jgi:hypothetical protein
MNSRRLPNTAWEYLQSLDKAHLSAAEIEEFLAHLARQEPESREEALAYLLRTVQLTPQQVVTLSETSPVRTTVGLQLLLKRYARAQQYASSNAAETKRLATGWAKAAEFVKALISSIPPI